jgi:hypothetical protein
MTVKYEKPQITIYWRENGRPCFKVIGYQVKRQNYVITGAGVTFINITCQVKGVSKPKRKSKTSWRTKIRRILRHGL